MKGNTWNPDLIADAWHFATLKHTGQTYGGKNPDEHINYLNHIGLVTMELMWLFQQSEKEYNQQLTVLCAILHDTVEDTATTINEIKEMFGEKVAHGVAALTKNKKLAGKQQQMLDSLNRIVKQPAEIWLVKMADRITNLYHPPYNWSLEKINNYREEAKLIHQHLHTADQIMANRLANRIKHYKQFV